MTHANGTQSRYSYDVAGRLTDLQHQNSTGTVLDQYTYTHDALGNRLNISRPEDTNDYNYDPLDRLTQNTASPLPGSDANLAQPSEGFTYDPVGNRISGPEGAESHAYNTGNQLTSSLDKSYEYDKNGNLIYKSTPEGNLWYFYDFENRLERIWGEDAAGRQNKHVYYRYDAFARRIEKLVWKFNTFGLAIGTEWFFYLYDNEDIIVTEKQTFDFNGLNTEVTHNLHGPGIDEPLMAQNSQKTYYYHADGLGSITALTDETEAVIEEYSYSAFGEIKKKYGNLENPYTYTGRELDNETGLYFYRARYYDAEAGRFLSFDPILRGYEHTEASTCNKSINSLPLNSPQDLTPYVYVLNNPINLTDPFGKSPWYGNYCGPGNNPGSAIDKLDSVCQEHDTCYAKEGLSFMDVAFPPKNPKSLCEQDKCDDKLCSEAKIFLSQTFRERAARFTIIRIFCD